MKVRCKKCEHEWEYKGHSKYYVTCPECYNKVNISIQMKGGKNKDGKNRTEQNI